MEQILADRISELNTDELIALLVKLNHDYPDVIDAIQEALDDL